MNVNVVDLDQKELVILHQKEKATKAEVEHSSRHGGSLLFDLKSIENYIGFVYFCWKYLLCTQAMPRCAWNGNLLKEVSVPSQYSPWNASRSSYQEMLFRIHLPLISILRGFKIFG